MCVTCCYLMPNSKNPSSSVLNLVSVSGTGNFVAYHVGLLLLVQFLFVRQELLPSSCQLLRNFPLCVCHPVFCTLSLKLFSSAVCFLVLTPSALEAVSQLENSWSIRHVYVDANDILSIYSCKASVSC